MKDPRVSTLFPVVHYWCFLLFSWRGTFAFNEDANSVLLVWNFSEGLSSRTDFLKYFWAESGLGFFPAICFPGEIWSGFPLSLLPVKIPIREKIQFYLGSELGASSILQPVMGISCIPLLLKHSWLGLWQKLRVRILSPGGFNEEDNKHRLMKFLQQFAFWWILASSDFYLV